jgi:hypothetical protein
LLFTYVELALLIATLLIVILVPFSAKQDWAAQEP